MAKKNNFWLALFQQTVSHFGKNEATKMAAALSFYTVLALPALLMLLIVGLGAFLGEQSVQGEINQQISDLMGKQAAEMISMIAANTTQTNTGLLFSVIGILGALFSVVGIFLQLQNALNQIWQVRPKNEGNFILNFLKTRLSGLLIIFNILLLIIGGVVLSSIAHYFSEAIASQLSVVSQYVVYGSNLLISYGMFFLVFLAIFKLIPDIEISWAAVVPGAFLTTVLFGVGRYLLGWYLGSGSSTSAFGVAGALMLIFLWIYYTSIILFFGAAFTQTWNVLKQNIVQTKPHANFISIIEQEVVNHEVTNQKST